MREATKWRLVKATLAEVRNGEGVRQHQFYHAFMSRARTRVVMVLFAFATLIVLGIEWFVLSRQPLPDIGQIDRVRVRAFLPERQGPVEFEVPQECLPRIWAALQPAKRDPSPAKWVVLGDLTARLKGGQELQLYLFTSDEPPGAFAAGPTWEERTYYRGGDSAELQKALAQAYEASRQRK